MSKLSVVLILDASLAAAHGGPQQWDYEPDPAGPFQLHVSFVYGEKSLDFDAAEDLVGTRLREQSTRWISRQHDQWFLHLGNFGSIFIKETAGQWRIVLPDTTYSLSLEQISYPPTNDRPRLFALSRMLEIEDPVLVQKPNSQGGWTTVENRLEE